MRKIGIWLFRFLWITFLLPIIIIKGFGILCEYLADKYAKVTKWIWNDVDLIDFNPDKEAYNEMNEYYKNKRKNGMSFTWGKKVADNMRSRNETDNDREADKKSK